MATQQRRNQVMTELWEALKAEKPEGWSVNLVGIASGDELNISVDDDHTWWVQWADANMGGLRCTRHERPLPPSWISTCGSTRYLVSELIKVLTRRSQRRTRGRVLARHDQDIVEVVTDYIGSEMHSIMAEHFSKEHMREDYWREAVEAVQATAEKQVLRILGVKAPRRSR